MTRRRFFASQEHFDLAASKVLLTLDEARHLRDALRLTNGDEVFVFNGVGQEFRCAIVKIGRETTELDLLEEVAPAKSESPLHLTLGVALLKGDKFDLVVQKATELGVHRVVPLVTRNADIHLRDPSDANKRVTRWQRIAVEAAKQCGRAFVAEINLPVLFSDFILDRGDLCLMFSERDGKPLSESTRNLGVHTSITAAIGSEGGWTDQELTEAQANGWKLVTLGGRILRAETAAITITALLQHEFGDLK